MVPQRKRARALTENANQAPSTKVEARGKNSASATRADDNDSDDEQQAAVDVMELCMQYGVEYERKHNAKAASLRKELDRIVEEYSSKVEASLLFQEAQIQALYATYRQEALRLAEERKLILDQLHQNYQKFEQYRSMLAQRSVDFETSRYNKTKKTLEALEQYAHASNVEFQKSLHSKRSEVDVDNRNARPDASYSRGGNGAEL